MVTSPQSLAPTTLTAHAACMPCNTISAAGQKPLAEQLLGEQDETRAPHRPAASLERLALRNQA